MRISISDQTERRLKLMWATVGGTQPLSCFADQLLQGAITSHEESAPKKQPKRSNRRDK